MMLGWMVDVDCRDGEEEGKKGKGGIEEVGWRHE